MAIRIAHISTSDRGGAAVAAQQIVNKINNHEVESTLISRESLQDLHHDVAQKVIRNFTGKLISSYQIANTRPPFGITTPISISNIDTRKLIRQGFDIIHIHNWYNILSVRDLSNLSRERPLVFTFHDERLMTGGCHTTLGCERFVSGCNACPAVRTNKKSISKSRTEVGQFFSTSSNVSVISPSQWVIEQFQRSGLDKRLRSLTHIPNIISDEFLMPANLKHHWTKTIKLLFIAADISVEMKGLSLLINAINILSDKSYSIQTPSIELHVIGRGNLPVQVNANVNVFQHGFQSKTVIRQIISEATFLVVPSLSENSPNVIAEAQLSGLPVIASNIGGIPELIEDSVTGFLTPTDPHLMAATLERAFSFEALSLVAVRARNTALKRYDPDLIAKMHLEIYRRALSEK